MKAGDRYQQYTYRELLRSVASVARSLSENGIDQGDRVALLSENRPEWMIAYLAVVSCGAVIVPLDAQLTEKEVAVLLCELRGTRRSLFPMPAFRSFPKTDRSSSSLLTR